MDLDHDVCYRALCHRDARFDGRFFVGVKTTGVYCRPVCPARTPLSKNVQFFLTAAAAQEAHFRPCLRCYPERAPDMGDWRRTSQTVSRALRLIEHGALDQSNLEYVADRLGVGQRQLRRLFREHLGASPVAVAQTRRLLLAKQLIRETQLSMTEVAFASGFSSIRRFNETILGVFGRAPGNLRRFSEIDTASSSEGGINLMLRYQPPYDWEAMLEFLRQRAIPGVENIADGCYSRTIELDDVHGSVAVAPTMANSLRVQIHFPRLSLLPRIIARLRSVFDLSADPRSIGAHLAQDPTLAPLVAMRPGLRVPGAWDGFELAIRAVLGEQVTVAAATRLAGKLVAAYGAPIPSSDSKLTHLFPRPSVIAKADLTNLGPLRSRATALSAVAVAYIADPDLFRAACDLDEAVRRLREIRGIGEWTAQYIALRQLREPDAFPAGDIGLMRALADNKGQCLSAGELLSRAEPWRPWRAYAAQHLWASAASHPGAGA